MHEPVMKAEVLEGLAVKAGGRYIDATLGEGGHAEGVAGQMGAEGCLLGLDRDADALKTVEGRWRMPSAQTKWVQTNFSELEDVAKSHGFSEVDGVLFDLGVRSDQLDRAERGFSFQQEGPLDMRMDARESLTAATLVNEWPERDVADLLWRLGEERQSRRIAAAIARRRSERPFDTTTDLAAVVEKALGGRRGRIHPATRTFMALRMAVNAEMESLTAGLEGAINCLKTGGRLAVLSFHSVEDRIVKQIMTAHVGRWASLQAGGERWEGVLPQLAWVNKKPLTPGPDEIERNPRARSAKLRVVERIDHET